VRHWSNPDPVDTRTEIGSLGGDGDHGPYPFPFRRCSSRYGILVSSVSSGLPPVSGGSSMPSARRQLPSGEFGSATIPSMRRPRLLVPRWPGGTPIVSRSGMS
jgi:hypothetical protein